MKKFRFFYKSRIFGYLESYLHSACLYPLLVEKGEPQGSILGPFLFFIFMVNDITKLIPVQKGTLLCMLITQRYYNIILIRLHYKFDIFTYI